MNCSELSDDDLDLRLWLANERMIAARRAISKPCCDECKRKAELGLGLARSKFALLSVEILYRTSFKELEDTMQGLQIDYVNTVNPQQQ